MKMNRIFALMLAAISLVSIDCFAQPGGGGGGGQGGPGGGGQGGGQRGPMMSENIDLVASSGLFSFDIEELISDSKIKGNDKIDKIKMLYAEYQKTVDNTTMRYADQIKEIRAVEKVVKEKQQSGDYRSIRESMQGITDYTKEISAIMRPEHVKFNEAVKAVLTEKEFKKWSAKYEDICKDNSFSLKERQRGERGEGGQGGGQRGQGGGGQRPE